MTMKDLALFIIIPLTVVSAMISGLRLERWFVRHGAPIPNDIGAPIGAVVGIAMAAMWFY